MFPVPTTKFARVQTGYRHVFNMIDFRNAVTRELQRCGSRMPVPYDLTAMKMEELKFSVLWLIPIFSFLTNTYSQETTIRVDTDLVMIPVTVRDRDGRYVPNLKREDFRVFENGEEQQVAFFETAEQPVTIFLLLDLSKSMEGYDAELANAANGFLSQLRPKDQVLIAYFCDYTKMLRERESVENIRNNKIKLKFCGKHTQLYEAVEYAFEKIRKIDGRKALVLFSDGVDSGIPLSSAGLFFVTAKSTLKNAEELDATIYSVQFGRFSFERPKTASRIDWEEIVGEVNSYMPDLAEVTGGRYFRVEDISDLGEAFANVARELSQQYSVGYYPKEPGKRGERRRIKVRVNVPGAAVRARSSYIVGSPRR